MSVGSMLMAAQFGGPAEAQLAERSTWRAVRSWTMQGRGVDLHRSTADLDFTCLSLAVIALGR